MKHPIAFSPPDMGEQEIAAVTEVIRSGWITTGPKTKEFERRLSEYCGTARTACLGSATAALELTLRLLGIGPGDEVITSAYTYTASASVICHVGATPVLVDTAPGSYEMDLEQIKTAITPHTKAIIPVDIAGIMCDYDGILGISRETAGQFSPSQNPIQRALGRIAVIADAAHSIGAYRGGRRSGQAADFSCFSFHAVKNLTTGEGGAATWNSVPGIPNEEIYRQYMLLSLHGQSKDALEKARGGSWEYDILFPAYKCNMTDIQAAIGLVQLSRYPALLQRRKKLFSIYQQELAGAPISLLPHVGDGYCSSHHLCLTNLMGLGEKQRNEVIRRMAEQGIAVNVHYKPLPLLTAYRNLGFCIQDYPNAMKQYQTELTLPLHTLLSDEDVQELSQVLKDILYNIK